jgi:uncharacterized protein YjbI with pentapeptide repeats
LSKLYIVADEKLDENINPEEDTSAEESLDSDDLELDNSEELKEENLEEQSEVEENLELEEPEVKENKALALVRVVLPKILAVARKFFSIQVIHVLYALGALLFSLFVFLLFEFKHQEKEQRLIGYVKIHHKVPEWHNGTELPEEAALHLKDYAEQQKRIKDQFVIIKEDRRDRNPVLGEMNEKPLTNEKFFSILQKQDLGRITQSNVEKPENMNLSGYDLSQFNYKYFREFIGADLRYTTFNEIEEEGLSFRGSSLAYAQFVDALIPRTNFIRTQLSYANFYSAVVDSSSFIGVTAKSVHFKKARMVSVNFKESKIIDSDFSETQLDQVNFKDSFLTGSNFNNSKLIKANFKNSNLQGSSFVNCDLEGADFTNANLEGVDFTGANLLDTKFDNADVTQAKFRGTQNVTLKQLEKVKFLLSARSIPENIIPKKKSWLERFKAPHDPH